MSFLSHAQLHPRLPGFLESLTTMARSAFREWFDPYRPERHYMRGPGPKWREKNGGESRSSTAAR